MEQHEPNNKEKQERTKKRKNGGHQMLLCRKSLKISKGQSKCNGQKKKYKRTNNDQQNIYIKLRIE